MGGREEAYNMTIVCTRTLWYSVRRGSGYEAITRISARFGGDSPASWQWTHWEVAGLLRFADRLDELHMCVIPDRERRSVKQSEAFGGEVVGAEGGKRIREESDQQRWGLSIHSGSEKCAVRKSHRICK